MHCVVFLFRSLVLIANGPTNFQSWWNLNCGWTKRLVPLAVFSKNFLPFYFVSVAAKMAVVFTLNLPSNSPKFCNNLDPPVDIYRATVYDFMPPQSMLLWIWERPNIASSSNEYTNCYVAESNIICFSARSAQSVVLCIWWKKEHFDPNKKYSFGSWVYSIHTRNRYIRLTEWGSLTRGTYLKARPIQELFLYSGKNVSILGFL